MIDLAIFNENIKNDKIANCYVFIGQDEDIIKEAIDSVSEKVVDKNFIDLNYTKIDGNSIEDENIIINACETMPFMSEKRVVVIYRANFLDNSDDKNKAKFVESLSKYIENIPDFCYLMMYYVLGDKREKPNNKKLNKFSKKAEIIDAKIEKRYKEEKIKEKITQMFEIRGAQIDKIEIHVFYSMVKEYTLGTIENEVEKLSLYVSDRKITREDINYLQIKSSDDDIFDMVDYLAQKKIDKALDILNKLLFQGEKVEGILFMVQRQFKLLLSLRISMEENKTKEVLAKELKLHPYICQNMMAQSKKFSFKQLCTAVEKCLDAEQKLKSSSINKKTEMELLLIQTII